MELNYDNFINLYGMLLAPKWEWLNTDVLHVLKCLDFRFMGGVIVNI